MCFQSPTAAAREKGAASVNSAAVRASQDRTNKAQAAAVATTAALAVNDASTAAVAQTQAVRCEAAAEAEAEAEAEAAESEDQGRQATEALLSSGSGAAAASNDLEAALMAQVRQLKAQLVAAHRCDEHTYICCHSTHCGSRELGFLRCARIQNRNL